MNNEPKDRRDKTPAPGSPEDLLPDVEPAADPSKDMGEDGEVPGGGNFA